MIQVHTVPEAFTATECGRIAALAEKVPAEEARLVGRARDHNLRRSELVWLDEVTGADWVMERIIDVVRGANRHIFGFDLAEFAESAQLARYDAAREGHFDWHSDIGDGALAARRKLTVVVQVSNPAEYAGGLLEVRPTAHVVAADSAQGAATLFPAFLLHRVAPVTAGVRRSLTVWAHGPAFR